MPRAKKDAVFYVYILQDPRKPGSYSYGFGESEIRLNYEPIYVGKGTRNRWRDHYHDTKKHGYNIPKDNKIKKLNRLGYEPLVSFIIYTKDEELAYDVEEEAILTIGRSKVKQGPLLNITDGRGMSGNVGFVMPYDAKAKISKAHMGKVLKESTKEKLKQFKGESNSRFGVVISDELMRIKKVVHIQFKHTVKFPDGSIHVVYNLNKFAREHNLSDSHLYQTLSGNRSHHKGFAVVDRVELPKNWIYSDSYDDFLAWGGDDIKSLYVYREVYDVAA